MGGAARLLVLVCLTAGCQPPAGPAADGAPGSSIVAGAAAEVLTDLERLDVRPETNRDSYRRAAYGRRWADVDGDGCRTRDQILYAAAAPGVRTAQQGRCAHDVLAGTWTDYYTGQTLTFTDLKDQRQAQAVTLDHLVSLAEADRSGASSWPARRKLEFANDAANLRVTAGTVNSAKGDRDPADWQPPTAARCTYATAYTRVKTRWQLAVDRDEHDALRRVLSGCTDT